MGWVTDLFSGKYEQEFTQQQIDAQKELMMSQLQMEANERAAKYSPEYLAQQRMTYIVIGIVVILLIAGVWYFFFRK